MRRSVLLAFGLVLLQFAAAAYLYPRMPDQIATHWNLAGEADGYGSKSMGLFMIPVLELVLVPVFLALPRIDPRADREKMMGTYSWFILAFTGYMTYFYGITLAWNLGHHYNFLRLVVPMLGMLFYGLGMLIQNVEMNWFLGIRTPWTLSSEEVWRDTHKLGGKLFKICGVLTLGGLFFSGWVTLFLVVVPMILSGIYLMVYSYQKYRLVQRE